MKNVRLIALVLLFALTACTSTQNGQTIMGPPDTSPVIFSYDGRTYTADDYNRLLEEQVSSGITEMLAQGQTREQIEKLATDTNVRGVIFDQMVQEALLTRYARQNGIGVSPSLVDDAVLQSVTPAENSPFLITAPERVKAATEQLRLEVNARNTRADMIRARQILVLDQATADKVIADLNGGADFAVIAREQSLDGNSKDKGGDLGWIARGNNPTEFDDVAFAAEPTTTVSATSELGVHVIQVLERQEARPFGSFEELRKSASAQQFYEESFVPWYDELRSQAEESGELLIAPDFDPTTVPLPYPPGTP
jgi:peptidyl-prolyl cis-trans isomerase C